MDQTNRHKILDIINDWWIHENIDEDTLLARVVLIYKKGDTNLCENYRPISLLNTMYKIMAAAIHTRLERGMEQHLQKTQYGFRKLRGAQDALYN
eukprot:8879750-Karenia_brevis.AAC.1